MTLRASVVVVALLATVALADEQAFRAAGELAAANDPRALDAYEAAGAARPITRWTDDAWVEAARLAEKARDYDRARRDLEQAIAISSDAQLLRRATNDLARLTQLTGGGRWSAIAGEHERLVNAIAGGGDPRSELAELEALAKANPGYPRGVAVRIAIARTWEQEDEVERALGWLRDAIQLADRDAERAVDPREPARAVDPREPARAVDPREPARARIELVRMLIRHRQLAEARRELPRIGDASLRASLERALDAGAWRQVVGWIAIALLAVLAGVAGYLLRRRTGGGRAALRALARPPVEVIYFVPIAGVVGFFATTGNPLVAKAVIWILIGAALIAWGSGATLEAARRRGPITMRHALVHAAVVGVAIVAAVYLAIDHARLLDLVAETWRTGPGK